MFQHQTEYSPEYNPNRNTTIYFFLADYQKCSVCMNFLLITRFTSREETETKGLRALDEYWRLHTLMAELVRFYEGWTLVIQMKVNVRSFWSFTSQNLIWIPGGILPQICWKKRLLPLYMKWIFMIYILHDTQ